MNPLRNRYRPLKTIVFRLLAILVGLAPFAAVEMALHLADLGQRFESHDPYVSFHTIRPLFTLDQAGARYRVDSSRVACFRPESFAVDKQPGEFRVFCLGGSTVQGRPYAIETSFTTWLELSLQAAEPDREWDVINCGGVSYASYRLVPILRELLNYEPDLIVLYAGHNEFLEDRTYGHVKDASSWRARLHESCSHLRSYNLGRSTWGRWNRPGMSKPWRTVMPTEVDALLDYQGGLLGYQRDDAWQRGTVAHYRLNLQRMIHMARSAGVPVLLANPVSNLKDCPPFKSENGEDLSAEQLARFRTLWEKARGSNDPRQQIRWLERARDIDGRHANALYLLAKCYEVTGRAVEAKAAFQRALDEDICPLRMIEPLHQTLLDVARSTGTPLVDARGLFEERSRDGIPGHQWMLDHVHPSINGHQLIAGALFQEMSDAQMVAARPGWQQRQQKLYRDHLQSLRAAYFVRGSERLEGLIYWTQGRADKIKHRARQPRSA